MLSKARTTAASLSPATRNMIRTRWPTSTFGISSKVLILMFPSIIFPAMTPDSHPLSAGVPPHSSFTPTGSIIMYIRLLPMTCIKANCNDNKAGPRMEVSGTSFLLSQISGLLLQHLCLLQVAAHNLLQKRKTVYRKFGVVHHILIHQIKAQGSFQAPYW